GDADTNSASIELFMDQDRTVTAHFVENVTSQGVPHGWMAYYGWTNNFDDAATHDLDGDGHMLWQEYHAGTDPANAASVMQLQSNHLAGAGSMVMSWSSVTGRTYYIEQAGNPDGPWLLQFEGIPATPPVNTMIIELNETNNAYYRIGIDHVQ
ncbi:MAG: hypothetical protein ACO398_09725, partial [Kiritimatiellia bacterium]